MRATQRRTKQVNKVVETMVELAIHSSSRSCLRIKVKISETADRADVLRGASPDVLQLERTRDKWDCSRFAVVSVW